MIKRDYMERNICDVLNQIEIELCKNGNYDSYIKKLNITRKDIEFKAPECVWNYVFFKFIILFIPPESEIDFKILSIWTTKSVEELKSEVNNDEKH